LSHSIHAEKGVGGQDAQGRVHGGPHTFADAHLNVGDTVYLEFSGVEAHGRASATVVGWREGHSVLVTMPLAGDRPMQLFDGEPVTLRMFNGRSAFAFQSVVRRVASLPFPYVHLAYPRRVQSVEIRRSPRSRVDMPATFSVDGQPAGVGTVVDIGTAGALLDTGRMLDKLVQHLTLSLSFELHLVPVQLTLSAHILGMKAYASTGETTHVQYRLAFQSLQPNDRLVLASLVWFEMYEHPENIV